MTVHVEQKIRCCGRVLALGAHGTYWSAGGIVWVAPEDHLPGPPIAWRANATMANGSVISVSDVTAPKAAARLTQLCLDKALCRE